MCARKLTYDNTIILINSRNCILFRDNNNIVSDNTKRSIYNDFDVIVDRRNYSDLRLTKCFLETSFYAYTLLARHSTLKFRNIVFPRRCVRVDCYFINVGIRQSATSDLRVKHLSYSLSTVTPTLDSTGRFGRTFAASTSLRFCRIFHHENVPVGFVRRLMRVWPVSSE